MAHRAYLNVNNLSRDKEHWLGWRSLAWSTKWRLFYFVWTVKTPHSNLASNLFSWIDYSRPMKKVGHKSETSTVFHPVSKDWFVTKFWLETSQVHINKPWPGKPLESKLHKRIKYWFDVWTVCALGGPNQPQTLHQIQKNGVDRSLFSLTHAWHKL